MIKQPKPPMPSGRGAAPDSTTHGGQQTGAAAPGRGARRFLLPGELFTGRQTTMVETLLGSCVAVTMYSSRCGVGAVCHGMLPACPSVQPCRSGCPDGTRYVDCSIRRMLTWFTTQGILHSEIEVKIFGGSDMFPVSTGESKRPGVGRQNIAMPLQVLEQDGLAPVATDLGDHRGRKIYFKTDTGEGYLTRLTSTMS